jgi:hypothetical protein
MRGQAGFFDIDEHLNLKELSAKERRAGTAECSSRFYIKVS